MAVKVTLFVWKIIMFQLIKKSFTIKVILLIFEAFTLKKLFSFILDLDLKLILGS